MSFRVSFCSCVFNPFGVAVTSFGEGGGGGGGGAGLGAFHTFVRFVLV